MKKLFGGVSSSMLILLLIGFAMPWVQVSCSGTPVIEQSGFQVLTGGSTNVLADAFKDKAGAEPSSPEPEDSSGAEEKSNPADNAGSAWWLTLVLLGGFLGAVGGILAIVGKKPAGIMAIAGGGSAAVILTATLLMGFPVESSIDQKNAESADKDKSDDPFSPDITFEVTYEFGLWLALVAVWLQAGSGIALMVSKNPPPKKGGPRPPMPGRPRPGMGPGIPPGPPRPYGQGQPGAVPPPRQGVPRPPSGPPMPGAKRTALPGKAFKMPGKITTEPESGLHESTEDNSPQEIPSETPLESAPSSGLVSAPTDEPGSIPEESVEEPQVEVLPPDAEADMSVEEPDGLAIDEAQEQPPIDDVVLVENMVEPEPDEPVEAASQDISSSAEPTEPETASEQPVLDDGIVEASATSEPEPTPKPVTATKLAILELLLLAVGLEDSKLDERKARAMKGITKAFGADVAQRFDAMSLVLEEDSTAATRIQEFIDPILGSSNPRIGSSVVRIVKFILKDDAGFSASAAPFIARLEDLISGGAQDATVMISSTELQQELQEASSPMQAPPPLVHQAPPQMHAPPPPMHQAPPPMHAPPPPMHQAPPPMHAPPPPMHQAPPPMHAPPPPSGYPPPPPQQHQPNPQFGQPQEQDQVSMPRQRKRRQRR